MFVCPQCQFENPEENKFCQRCGTSLTHKSCAECGAEVEWGTIICGSCGAFTGTCRWVVLSRSSQAKPLKAFPTKASVQLEESEVIDNTPGVVAQLEGNEIPTADLETADLPESTNPSKANQPDLLPAQTPVATPSDLDSIYVDREHRYRLLEISQEIELPGQSGRQMVNGVVVDLQPLQPAFRQENQNIPIAIALPYQELQELFYFVIPSVYDAWEESEQSVVILEDRSEWDQFVQVLQAETLPLIQVLHWLDEMVQLWQPLVDMGYGKSLLTEENLYLDEDQSLCLQQLYPDDPQSPPSLSQLGQLWKQSLPQPELERLIQDLMNGEITTATEARSRLTEIAQSQAKFSPEVPTDITMPAESGDIPTVLLPMQLASMSEAGITDVGMQRRHNEDYFGMYSLVKKQETATGTSLEAKGLYVLCDGMGGHAAGEVASAMTVEHLLGYFQDYWYEQLPDSETIRQGIEKANQAVYDVNQQNASAGSGRMGTTLVMALVQDTKVAIAHVGDSRIYRYTQKRGLEQLTTDHEVGQREIARGVEPDLAYARADAYQLTQAIGPRDNSFIHPDVNFLEINEDTLLLLCSDGLSDNNLLEDNTDEYIAPLLRSKTNLEQGLYDLIHFANDYNGHDNLTAVAIRLKVRPNLEQNSMI
jgi:protein phosphatase